MRKFNVRWWAGPKLSQWRMIQALSMYDPGPFAVHGFGVALASGIGQSMGRSFTDSSTSRRCPGRRKGQAGEMRHQNNPYSKIWTSRPDGVHATAWDMAGELLGEPPIILWLRNPAFIGEDPGEMEYLAVVGGAKFVSFPFEEAERKDKNMTDESMALVSQDDHERMSNRLIDECRKEIRDAIIGPKSLPEDGGMEKVRDCRDCKNYSRNWSVNYCDIPIPPCFDMSEMAMVHQEDFIHGLIVYAESACAHFAPGKHPTRQRFEEASPQIAAAARRHVKTIVEKTEQFTVTTLPCQAELAAMCALAAGVLIGLMIGFFIWRVAFQ